jgi:glutathione S-transferase
MLMIQILKAKHTIVSLIYLIKLIYSNTLFMLGIQRGHQHTLEVYPEFLLMLGLGSIKYPLISSVGGVIWLLGRIAFFQVLIKDLFFRSFYLIFFKGYSTGHPEKRRYGSFSYIGLFTMMGCAVKSIYDLIRA